MQSIQNEFLKVQINPFGARLWSIQDRSGKEYLWQGDERYWTDKAPNLFPYIARLTEGKYSLGGKEYHMDIHGFAKDSQFDVVDEDSCEKMENRVVLQLQDSEESYGQYPYHFVLKIIYELQGNVIHITYEVDNRDDKTMYFGIGGHPGFNVPLEEGMDFSDYYLEFGEKCNPRRVIFSEDCFVVGEVAPYELQDGCRLPLRHDMFDEDAIVLTDMAGQVTLRSKKGSRGVRVSYPDMPYLGFWHRPGTEAPYVCIEPWSSLPSRKGIVEALETKPGLIALQPGSVYRNHWSIEMI